MTVIKAIKEGFKITNQNKKLVLIVFCVNLFFSFSSILFFPSIGEELKKIGPIFLIAIIAALVSIFVIIFIDCGIRGSLKDVLLQGDYQGNRFFLYCRKYFLRLFGLGILLGGVYLITISCLFISSIAAAKIFAVLGKVGVVISAIMAIILGLFILRLFLILFYAYTTIVIEDSKISLGIAKSFKFLKMHVRKVLGLLLILLGISGVIEWGLKKITQIETVPTSAGYGIEIMSCGLQAYLEVIVIVACMILYLALREEPSPEKSEE